MKLSDDLAWRGLIKDKTFAEISWLDEPRSFYLGIDASANSLTVGNLAILMLARRLAAAGWQAYLVMGGGTSLVGDPGGKTEERQLMSREIVQDNIEKIKDQVSKLFKGEEFKLVDNYDWLSKLKYVDFLREVGKHFSMTELMQRDFVVERMGKGGKGISYAEFSYSLVQGYDFWHLFKEHGVVMQIGGSDQWGNLLSGVSLIRKKESKESHALSMPLVINKATGQKFGKTEEGAVWLDAKLTSPSDFYQFWINADDDGAEDYLKVYTLLSKDEIERTITEHKQDPSKRLAQSKLAIEVTKLLHGEEAANKARQEASALSGSTSSPVGPSLQASIGDGIVDVLLESGLVGSKTEARQLLASQGVYINDEPVSREKLEKADFVNGVLKLRRGKKLKNTTFVELK